MDLLPLKATFAPADELAVEVRGATKPATVTLWHLDRLVAFARLRRGQRVVRFAPQREGGYGVEAVSGDRVVARSALDVLADPLSRPRYGFVSRFEPDRDVRPVIEHARRLHLNVVQFYDWMYRHAKLVPPTDRYDDPLGRRLSLATVRRFVRAFASVGALPLGYAAVYAVGRDAWPAWRDAGLYRPDGEPWRLGEDFLWLVDPGDRRWQRHFSTELRRAAEEAGFAGFHLDQYGWPKHALRADGSEVDVGRSFVELIRHVRRALPSARLIFNNVNDFPTWLTAHAPQDAVYIEVWPPNERLAHLAELTSRARQLGCGKAAILAAYPSLFQGASGPGALAALRLTMATVFSHGGFHLANGEDGALLTDPYYPHHHRLRLSELEVMRRWYDFIVRFGDLLYDRSAVDVTRILVDGPGGELRIRGSVPTSIDPDPGTVWTRVVDGPLGMVIHLVNLSDQSETAWNTPKTPARSVRGLRLAILRTSRSAPAFFVADPDRSPALTHLPSRHEDGYDVVTIPPFRTWAVVWRDDRRARKIADARREE